MKSIYRINTMPSKVGTYKEEVVYFVQKRIKLFKWYFWVSVLHGSGKSYWVEYEKKWAESFKKDLEMGKCNYNISIFKPSQRIFSGYEI